MIILRWLLFLPIGLTSAAILQALPIFAFYFAQDVEWRFTLLNVIIALFVASLALAGVSMWFMGVLMTPYMACFKIAPNNKIASVIFGTLFVLFQGLAFIHYFIVREVLGVIIYHSVFSFLLIAGIVMAYKEEKRTMSPNNLVDSG